MITGHVESFGASRGITELIRVLKINPRIVVAKETGELIKTLVRISPPKNPAKTRADIQKKISSRFQALGEQSTRFEQSDKAEGKTGIKWYGASSKYLFGGARDSDLRKADQRTLLHVYYRARSVQGSQRIVLPFKNRNTRQRVAILTKIITTTKQVAGLVKRVQGHVGRLKAGWLVAVTRGPIKITGANMPKKWVTKHAAGARGTYINGLRKDGDASFTIINQAKGVTGKKSVYWVGQALKIRAKAMLVNARMFAEGKKYLSDYARGSALKL